jgi:hypothetical protein
MRPYVIIHPIFYISILKKLEIVSIDQFESFFSTLEILTLKSIKDIKLCPIRNMDFSFRLHVNLTTNVKQH